jgi:hypothetical protein
MIKSRLPERWMSGLSRTPGKRVYDESRTAGSNPALSATKHLASFPRYASHFRSCLKAFFGPALRGINGHQ